MIKLRKKLTKQLKKYKKKSNDETEKLDENVQDDISPIEEEHKNDEDKTNISQIKKLYREIVKLTHPDKVKSNKHNELYIKSSKYYESGNKIGIYSICNELDIEYEIEEDDVILISEQISNLKNKINFIESTFAWQWYNCEDEMLKSQILLNFIKLKIK